MLNARYLMLSRIANDDALCASERERRRTQVDFHGGCEKFNIFLKYVAVMSPPPSHLFSKPKFHSFVLHLSKPFFYLFKCRCQVDCHMQIGNTK
jgi:hypothetical protein